MASSVFGAARFEDARWPKCKSCGRPMPSLGVFHAHPEQLPLGALAALTLFQCEGGCPLWDPDKEPAKLQNPRTLMDVLERVAMRKSTPSGRKPGTRKRY